jgi:hypothetical protein
MASKDTLYILQDHFKCQKDRANERGTLWKSRGDSEMATSYFEEGKNHAANEVECQRAAEAEEADKAKADAMNKIVPDRVGGVPAEGFGYNFGKPVPRFGAPAMPMDKAMESVPSQFKHLVADLES